MDITQVKTASPEQIAAFKMGAAARYQERGVAPAKADELFSGYVSKLAEEAGLTPKVDQAKCEKIAAELKAHLAKTPVKK